MEAAEKSQHKSFGIKVAGDRGISIGQLVDSVSQLVGRRCTPAMIYNYEKHGLIAPPERTEGGFRLFRIEDIHRVVCIKRMQSQGMSLAAIKENLDECADGIDSTRRSLDLPVDRRTQVLQAAAVVFPQKGYAATTLQDIAQEAGVATSAIYQYFHNKEDLFLALIDNLSFIPILDEINRSLDDKKDFGYEDIRHSLIKVGKGYLDTHIQNADIVRLFLSEARLFPEVGKHYIERLVLPVEKMLEHYLSAQMDRGVLRQVNVELAVRVFYGIFLNLIVTQYLLADKGEQHYPERNRVQPLVDIYLMGLVHFPNTETSA